MGFTGLPDLVVVAGPAEWVPGAGLVGWWSRTCPAGWWPGSGPVGWQLKVGPAEPGHGACGDRGLVSAAGIPGSWVMEDVEDAADSWLVGFCRGGVSGGRFSA